MSVPLKTLEIRTMGDFSLMVGERAITAEWPDETTKMLFCTLLSPLDEAISMERLCRSLWEVPATQASMSRIAAKVEWLSDFFAKEASINPFIINQDHVGIDSRYVRIDAHEFYLHAVKGLRLMSIGNRRGALINLHKADQLYCGWFLPLMDNRVITTTRENLGEIHRMVANARCPSAGL